MRIRRAGPEDAPALLRLIEALAEFEGEPEAVTLTANQLAEDLTLSPDGPSTVVWIAMHEDTGAAVGLCFCYWAYSTWKGRTFYLEDLYVAPAYRRHGLGTQMLHQVFEYALARKAARIAWQVLDWNAAAIAFYHKTGAELDGGWINVRFQEGRLEALERQMHKST